MQALQFAGERVLGEGPRSGGGKDTSGAGAQRKEGVQPPGYRAVDAEVRA